MPADSPLEAGSLRQVTLADFRVRDSSCTEDKWCMEDCTSSSQTACNVVGQHCSCVEGEPADPDDPDPSQECTAKNWDGCPGGWSDLYCERPLCRDPCQLQGTVCRESLGDCVCEDDPSEENTPDETDGCRESSHRSACVSTPVTSPGSNAFLNHPSVVYCFSSLFLYFRSCSSEQPDCGFP